MARVKQLRKSRLACAAALAFCMTAGSAPYAFALTLETGTPDISIFAHAQEIPDSALSHMRGRFISQGQIVSFGINMVSQWITPLGQTLTAGATMVVKFAQNSATVSFEPNLNITQTTPTSPPPQNSTLQTASGGGIRNVSGVGQSIQVAGDSNSITNNASISVTTDNIDVPAGGSSAQGMYSQGGSSGSVTAYLTGSSAGVRINVPQGQVIQQIQGGATNIGSSVTGSGLVQLVQTTGSLQQIQNVARLEIQLKSLNGLANQANFNQALDTLRGLQH